MSGKSQVGTSEAALWLRHSNEHAYAQYTTRQLMHGQPVNTSYVALGSAMLSLWLHPRDNIESLCNILMLTGCPCINYYVWSFPVTCGLIELTETRYYFELTLRYCAIVETLAKCERAIEPKACYCPQKDISFQRFSRKLKMNNNRGGLVVAMFSSSYLCKVSEPIQ